MSLPFLFPGTGLGQLPQLPGLQPLGAQPQTSTLSPELLQLVNGATSNQKQGNHMGHQVLDLLGPNPGSIRGGSVPPAEGGPGAQGGRGGGGGGGSQNNQYASRHQAAEQRRRTRINERLDALRTLVPHAERANTACFLEEVIKYIIRLKDRNEQLEGALEMLRAWNKPTGNNSTPRTLKGQPSQPQQPPLQQQEPVPSPHHRLPQNPLLPTQPPQQQVLGLTPEMLLSLAAQAPHSQQPSQPQQQSQLQNQLLILQLQQQQLLQQHLQQASTQPLGGGLQPQPHPQLHQQHPLHPISMDMQPHQLQQQLQAQQLQLLLPQGVMFASQPPPLGISSALGIGPVDLQQLQHLQQLQQQVQLNPSSTLPQPIPMPSSNGTRTHAGVAPPAKQQQQQVNGTSREGLHLREQIKQEAGGGGQEGPQHRESSRKEASPEAQALQQQHQPANGSNGSGSAEEVGGGAGGVRSGSQSGAASSEESRGVPPKKRKMLSL